MNFHLNSLKLSGFLLMGLAFFFVLSVSSCNKDGEGRILRSEEAKALKEEVTDVRTSFLEKVAELGFEAPYEPEIEIRNSEGLIFFEGGSSSGRIVVPLYEKLDDDMVAFFDALAFNADFTGEAFFRENFNWFLIPHELFHYVQTVQGSNLSPYQSELEANKAAVAYWKSVGETERLERFIGQSQFVLNNLREPADLSEDFINANYDNILSQPEVYGYLQFKLYQEALDSDPELSSFFQ